MSLSTRQALLIILAVFVGLTPFARAFGGVQWTIPVVAVLGLFIALCWKRFPEWQRQSDIKSAAAAKAFSALRSEFGKRAVVKWCLSILVALTLGSAVMALGFMHNNYLIVVVGAISYLSG